jgi:hypothetical protein
VQNSLLPYAPTFTDDSLANMNGQPGPFRKCPQLGVPLHVCDSPIDIPFLACGHRLAASSYLLGAPRAIRCIPRITVTAAVELGGVSAMATSSGGPGYSGWQLAALRFAPEHPFLWVTG